jgi:hypothetical protein
LESFFYKTASTEHSERAKDKGAGPQEHWQAQQRNRPAALPGGSSGGSTANAPKTRRLVNKNRHGAGSGRAPAQSSQSP